MKTDKSLPVNIVYIIDDMRVGGVERMLELTLRKLDRTKYNPQVYALFDGGPVADEIEKLRIPVYILGLNKFNAVIVFFRLVKMLLKNHIQIVHTSRLISDIFGTWASLMARVPIIISSKTSLPYYGKYIYCIMDRISMRYVTQLISVSDSVKLQYLKQLPINPDKIKTLYNGTEYNKFNREFNPVEKQNELGLEADDFIIGTVANLNWRKDLFTLLEAAKLVLAQYPNARFLLIGEGPQKAELQARAQQLGISSRVLFLGSRHDIPELLSLCRIFVISSVTEGLTVAILEAMAMGKPVVATSVGGIPEVVLDGETGFLVPPKAPDKIAQSIKKLISHKELATQFGAAGEKRVERYFSADRMVQGLEGLYHDLYNRRKQQE
jgi:glycosyltransferase involved in cell wall biosynthesis